MRVQQDRRCVPFGALGEPTTPVPVRGLLRGASRKTESGEPVTTHCAVLLGGNWRVSATDRRAASSGARVANHRHEVGDALPQVHVLAARDVVCLEVVHELLELYEASGQ